MAGILTIPSPLRKFTGGKAKLEVTGNTVSESLNELFQSYPELKKHLLDDSGNLRNFVNIYINSEDIRLKNNLNTEIPDGADIRIIPAIAGGSHNLPDLIPQELSRYARHFTLPEFGIEGQKKLKTSSVLIIGAGGLGSPVSMYLTAAGVGKIGLVDFDVVDESNLQRQILFGVDVLGLSKVDSARDRLQKLNPYVEIKIHKTQLTSDNALEILSEYDVVVDGTDNFPTRYLVNDACVILGKPNVYGSIFRFDGQASVFNFEDGPCYRCLYPEPPPPGLVPSCAEGGVLGVLPGIIGCIQANETIKILTGIGTTLKNRFMLFDALTMEFNELSLNKNPDCVVCGDNPSITELIDYTEFCGIQEQEKSNNVQEITVQELKSLMDTESQITVLDVREPFELAIAKIPGTTHIPMREVTDHINEFDTESDIIVHCKSGVRSEKICRLLLENNFKSVKNLKGGVIAWAKEIDPTIPTY